MNGATAEFLFGLVMGNLMMVMIFCVIAIYVASNPMERE